MKIIGYRSDFIHPINNNAENSIDSVEHYSLYKEFWIPKGNCKRSMSYIHRSLNKWNHCQTAVMLNAFRDKKAEGSADADADSSHSIHVDQNMKSLINRIRRRIDSGDIDG